MSKIKLFTTALITILCLGFYSYKASADPPLSPIFLDNYSITLSGNALNSTTALNIKVEIVPANSAQIDTGVSFKGNGATQLLTDVNQGTSTISVVWNGTITDGKATITGMLKPGTGTGTPALNIIKVEKAGGVDITKEITSTVNLTSSTPTTIPTPTPTPSPSPSPSPSSSPKPIPSPDPSPSPSPGMGTKPPIDDEEDEPSITISGNEQIIVQSGIINAGKLKVKAADFTALSKCTVSVSDTDLARIKPARFILGPGRTKQTLLVRVPQSAARDIIDSGDTESVTVEINCKNGAFDDTELLLVPEED